MNLLLMMIRINATEPNPKTEFHVFSPVSFDMLTMMQRALTG